MCIVLLSTAHPHYALILIDNRDEYVLRPTSRPRWWKHEPTGKQVLSAQDLQRAEKGTWLGVTRSGLFAVLTNYREERAGEAVRSRGGLVTRWLVAEEEGMTDRVRRLLDDGVQDVGGFSMLCGQVSGGTGAAMALVSNRTVDVGEVPLEGGTWGLSNTTDDDVRWPKVERGTEMLRRTVDEAVAEGWDEARLVRRLFGVLDTDTFPVVEGEEVPPLVQRMALLRHSIFVPAMGDAVHREAMRAAAAARESDVATTTTTTGASGFDTGLYGTQRQTVLLVDWDGRVKFVERALWDARGNAIPRGDGDVVHEFVIEAWQGRRPSSSA